MAKMNFGSLIAEMGSILHMDTSAGSEDEATIKRALEWAGRYIWTARPWPERKAVATISTVAPYSTGTATFTNASASVTGSGTTWTGFSARKMALAYNAPFYRILSVGSATAVTLARTYLETTASASAYIVYQDEYDTASTVDTILSAQLIHNQSYGPMLAVSEDRIDADATVQASSGKPMAVGLCVPTTAGTPRIRVTPVPDAVYAIELKYLKGWSGLTEAADFPDLDQNKESLLVEAALLFAQRPSDNRVMTNYPQVDELIKTYWNRNQNLAPITYQKRGFDHGTNAGYVYVEEA